MKDDRLKKLFLIENKKNINDSYQTVKRLSKIKIFDLDWLKANWDIQDSGRASAILLPNVSMSIGSLIMPKVESFLQASRILEKLDEEVKEEKSLKLPAWKKLFQESHFFNSELIYFLASADPSEDSLGHSSYVAAYTLLLARHYGLHDRKTLIDIERGALLHDIGKIGIPETILQKKEALTEEEMEIIRYHPLIGFAMIEEFGFLQGAAEIVLFHHERYDGSGYPFGLAGEEIPLSARLFSLADTLDAITSDRPYRRGRSLEEALEEIEKCRDSQFDPELVDIIQNIPVDRWEKAKEQARKALRVLFIN
ncbi:MAG TPA: HD-GYP domain-containing protein [Candidatus Saccharicenans sp.]|jgi:putative nucleotidyltransferase with HDIG domain|nr:HD-GYP domain-containing protein [Candidatus Saccharicenans sp.]